MLIGLSSEMQIKVLSYLNQKDQKKDILTCRLVCQQWNYICIEILKIDGIKVILNSKRKSKQFLHMLNNKKSVFNLTIHHLVIRSGTYLMDFIPIICKYSALKTLDLGRCKDFYTKFYELLIRQEGTSGTRDLPHIEEFRVNEEGGLYPVETLLTCNVISEQIIAFRQSIKRQHVVLDFIDVPGFYHDVYTLRDGLTEMPQLEVLTAKYFDIFPVPCFIEDVVNSNMKRIKNVEVEGIGTFFSSRPVARIFPVFSLRELSIILPHMNVSVLNYIKEALPNLESLYLLCNRNNYFESISITGGSPIVMLSIIHSFTNEYCVRIPQVIVSIFSAFFSLFVYVHRESGEFVDFIWNLFEQDEEFGVLANLFD